MSNQEQDHLEKTLAILSKRLAQAQTQFKNTKKTIYNKKAFLLSSKTILQQDLGHVFLLDDQNGTGRRRKKRVLQGPPPGLVPLLSNKGCKGIILQDRIWLSLTFMTGAERISHAHLTWIASPSDAWAPHELDRSTLHRISAATSITSQQQYVLYAATTIPPHLLLSSDQVKKMDIKIAVRYIVEDKGWMDSASVTIEWPKDHHWIMEDIENISHWASILYPHKVHLSSLPSITEDWTSLNEDIHLAPNASLLLIQGKGHPISPIQAHLYGIKNYSMASWLSDNNIKSTTVISWDGVALDTRQRLQHGIVSLVDQSQSSLSLSLSPSSHTQLANREHSLAQLSTLLPSPSSSASLFSK